METLIEAANHVPFPTRSYRAIENSRQLAAIPLICFPGSGTTGWRRRNCKISACVKSAKTSWIFPPSAPNHDGANPSAHPRCTGG